ncbi:MAG: DUF4194 domain-containing protein [Treponema sp.]|nr:DUF4194 domain-containing protein [Treponema sp.]
MTNNSSNPVWASICVKLLQGPIYKDYSATTWNTLTSWTSDIQNYFATIGLVVYVDQSDGYAFLKQADDDSIDSGNSTEDEMAQDTMPSDLPHLIRKIPLTPEVSLLCVLLREALDQFDTSQNQSSICVLKESDIKERLSVFIKEKSDQIKYYKNLDNYLSQLVNLSFLRELNLQTQKATSLQNIDREFEVRRIIRAKINIDFMEEFKRKLQEANGTQSSNEEVKNEQ